ncbi:MAG: hypothetical protein IKU67_01080 [Firmicutes bacterium]|nr:hypothetical protein [Bacillota bacterium]
MKKLLRPTLILCMLLTFSLLACTAVFASTGGANEPTEYQKIVAYCAIGLIAFCYIYKFIRGKIKDKK